MSKPNNLYRAIAGSPILWGSLATTGFYGLVRAEVLGGQLVRRYFASHPVEYVATTMFFIGLAALALKIMDVLGQYPGLSASPLGPAAEAGEPVDHCGALLARLDQLPEARQNDLVVQRLREALEHVRRRGSADTLDEELKYLADVDAARLHSSFALVRVIIWAIPILGFLGTVIGITLAIANLAPEALENSLPKVTAGLGVAFDTTALALGLSIVLMFAQFLTERTEIALLAQVDERAAAELEGRFEQVPDGPDGQLAVVRRMADTVLEATQGLVQKQAEIWQASIDASASRWAQMADAAGEHLQKSLTAALTESLETFAREIADAEQTGARQNQQHWSQVQQAQMQQTQATASLQASMADQADVLRRAVEASGEVARLEEALNRNLAALAGAKHFEQTVMSLSAAIHLLNAQLAEAATGSSTVQLESNRSSTQAA